MQLQLGHMYFMILYTSRKHIILTRYACSYYWGTCTWMVTARAPATPTLCDGTSLVVYLLYFFRISPSTSSHGCMSRYVIYHGVSLPSHVAFLPTTLIWVVEVTCRAHVVMRLVWYELVCPYLLTPLSPCNSLATPRLCDGMSLGVLLLVFFQFKLLI